jgi:hypothetical protein
VKALGQQHHQREAGEHHRPHPAVAQRFHGL